MSVSSPDHFVVPTADEYVPVAPATDPATDDLATGRPDDRADRDTPEVTFADLGLPEAVVRKLAQNGVTTPFPIQAATIPDALAGRDVLGRGRTGSGKTLSFGLPLLSLLAGGHTAKKHPRGVVLTPTRELAMQVADALQPYGDVLGLKIKVVCGGTSMANQIHALERGVDVLVATPGRLRDIIGRGACSLDSVQVAVLDEADQMADLGFLPEVTELLDQVPVGGQRMLFSATLDNDIDTLIKRYLHDPVTHEVDPSAGAVTTMSHHILIVKPRDKAPVTAAIAARKGRTIVFVRTQMGADRIAEQLWEAGVRADALHGGMTQGARTRTLADFKDGKVNVLVATDVAARGIHVDGIDLVLNVDPAGDHKDYLHRAGRTARAGRSGTVVSLALPHQRRQTFRLMEDAGVRASRHVISGGVFDQEVADITGARSMTEVQAESANRAARRAERDVKELTRELERAQRRATELRQEADLLAARAARERGEEPSPRPTSAQATPTVTATATAHVTTAPGETDGTGASGGAPGTAAPGERVGPAGSVRAAAGAEAVADAAERPTGDTVGPVTTGPTAGQGETVPSEAVPSSTATRANVDADTPDSGSTAAAGAQAGSAGSVPHQSRARDDRQDTRNHRYGRDDRHTQSDRYERHDRAERWSADRPSYDRRDRDRDRDRGFGRDRVRDGNRGAGRDRERARDRRFDRDRDFGRDRDRFGTRGPVRDREGRGGRPYDRRDGDRRGDRNGFERFGDRGYDRPRGFDRDRGREDRGFTRDRDRSGASPDRGGRGARDGFQRDDRVGRGGGDRPWDRDRPRHGDRSFRHDRPYHRDHRDRRDERRDRPSGGHRSGAGPDRPYGRRDDRRTGGPGAAPSGSTGSRRREDKPRWKRKG